MPHRHYPPAYLRYLKARLWSLGKPSFWVTAIFISVVGLVIKEYWANPNMLTYRQNTQVTDESSLSAEDQAIAADIDNLPVLFNDFTEVSLPPLASTTSEKSQANNSNNLLQEINKQQNKTSLLASPNGTSAPQVNNPFVLEAENLLQFRALNNDNQSFGMQSLSVKAEPTQVAATSFFPETRLVNQTANNQNLESVIPVQTPANQTTNTRFSGINNTTSPVMNSSEENSLAGGVRQIPSNNIVPSRNFVPGIGLNNGGITQIPANNISPSSNFVPSTGLNAGAGIQPNVLNNLPPNYDNNLNNGVSLTSPAFPTTVTSPVNSGIQMNMAPPVIQPPSENVITPITPVVADRNGNLIWQSPSQQMQSNFSNPRQIPQQNTGRVPDNRTIRDWMSNW